MRNFSSVLPSLWQQYVKSGHQHDFEEFLARRLTSDLDSPDDMARHDQAALVSRWVDVFGPENVTVIVVDKGEPQQVPSSFETSLGLPPGMLYEPDLRGESLNRPLSVHEASLVLTVNRLLAPYRLSRDDLNRLLFKGATARMLDECPAPDPDAQLVLVNKPRGRGGTCPRPRTSVDDKLAYPEDADQPKRHPNLYACPRWPCRNVQDPGNEMRPPGRSDSAGGSVSRFVGLDNLLFDASPGIHLMPLALGPLTNRLCVIALSRSSRGGASAPSAAAQPAARAQIWLEDLHQLVHVCGGEVDLNLLTVHRDRNGAYALRAPVDVVEVSGLCACTHASILQHHPSAEQADEHPDETHRPASTAPAIV